NLEQGVDPVRNSAVRMWVADEIYAPGPGQPWPRLPAKTRKVLKRLLEAAMEEDPDNPEPGVRLARVLLHAADHSALAPLLTKLSERFPGDREILRMRAEVALQNGTKAAALKAIRSL